MKTKTETKLIAYANEGMLKLWEETVYTFRNKIVEWHNEMTDEELKSYTKELAYSVTKYHVTYKENGCAEADNFEINANCFDTAYCFFKTEVERRGYENVMVCEDFNDYFPSYDEYEEDCEMEYEKDYGPSNPWDAPGMKISDFIKGVY